MFRLSNGQVDDLAKGYTLQVCVPADPTDESPESQVARLLDVNRLLIHSIGGDQQIATDAAGAPRGNRQILTDCYGAIVREGTPLDLTRTAPALLVVVHVVLILDPLHRRGDRRRWYNWPGHWRTGPAEFDRRYRTALRDNGIRLRGES